jgi:hypothetical protein
MPKPTGHPTIGTSKVPAGIAEYETFVCAAPLGRQHPTCTFQSGHARGALSIRRGIK